MSFPLRTVCPYSHTFMDAASSVSQGFADGMDITEDPVPLVNTGIALKSVDEPTRVTLQPCNCALRFVYSEGHGIIVAEYDQ